MREWRIDLIGKFIREKMRAMDRPFGNWMAFHFHLVPVKVEMEEKNG
jgi:hypothetical protein